MSGLKASDDGRRDAPGEKVLKDRRSPRERGRMGTSVRRTRLLFRDVGVFAQSVDELLSRRLHLLRVPLLVFHLLGREAADGFDEVLECREALHHVDEHLLDVANRGKRRVEVLLVRLLRRLRGRRLRVAGGVRGGRRLERRS